MPILQCARPSTPDSLLDSSSSDGEPVTSRARQTSAKRRKIVVEASDGSDGEVEAASPSTRQQRPRSPTPAAPTPVASPDAEDAVADEDEDEDPLPKCSGCKRDIQSAANPGRPYYACCPGTFQWANEYKIQLELAARVHIPSCRHGTMIVRIAGPNSQKPGKRYVRCEPCKMFAWIKLPKRARRATGGRARLNAIHVGQRIDSSSDGGKEDEDEGDLSDFVVSDDYVEVEDEAEDQTASDADAPQESEPDSAPTRKLVRRATSTEASDAHDSSFQATDASVDAEAEDKSD